MAHQLDIKSIQTYKREEKAKWWFSLENRYVWRNLRYMDELLYQGAQLNEWQTKRLAIIRESFDQQTLMYEQRTHWVPGRIFSLSQLWIRPIDRDKAKQRTEFGPKIDTSIADDMIDIERFDFNAFNESQGLAATINHYFDIHGYYPDEVLADVLYRTLENFQLCQRLGIKLSGPRLGRRP